MKIHLWSVEPFTVIVRTIYQSSLCSYSSLPYPTLPILLHSTLLNPTLLYCTRQECPHVRGAVPARVVGGLPHISTQHRHRCGRHRRLHCPRAGSGAGWGGSNSRSQHGEGTAASRSESQRDDFSQKDRSEDSMFEAGRDDGR